MSDDEMRIIAIALEVYEKFVRDLSDRSEGVRNPGDLALRLTLLEMSHRYRNMKARPTVVCLCGSTRFKDAFDLANYQESLAGKIVLSVGFFMHASDNKAPHGETIGCTPEQKILLDVLHKQKIDLADEVLVLNVGNYIGDSTRSEIEYAKDQGKLIRYLEELTMVTQ